MQRVRRYGRGASALWRVERTSPGIAKAIPESALTVAEQNSCAIGGKLDHHPWLTPVMGIGGPVLRRKPVVLPRPRQWMVRKHRHEGRPADLCRESESGFESKEAQGDFGGDAPQPETVRQMRLPSAGRYRDSTRATELKSGAPSPIPVCAGIAARRPARVVDSIWKRTGSSLAGERKET